MSCCEIIDEVIQDLLNARNRELSIEENPNFGIRINGPTKKKCVNDEEAIDVINRGTLARSTAMSDFGPLNNYSHGIYDFELIQEVLVVKQQSLYTIRFESFIYNP